MTSITQQNKSMGMPRDEGKSFEEFLGDWHHDQTRLLTEIKAAQAEITAANIAGGAGDGVADEGDRDINDLIGRVLVHFDEYFEQKSRITRPNVFKLFDPTWCSTFETAFFWITGFRPCILLQFVGDSVTDLTPQQIESVERLKREIMMDERDLEDRLASMQETTAAPPLSEILKSGRHHDPNFFASMDAPLQRLKATLEDLVENADSLRSTTASRVVEILNPTQCLAFLIAAIQLPRGMKNLKMHIQNMIRRQEIEGRGQE